MRQPLRNLGMHNHRSSRATKTSFPQMVPTKVNTTNTTVYYLAAFADSARSSTPPKLGHLSPNDTTSCVPQATARRHPSLPTETRVHCTNTLFSGGAVRLQKLRVPGHLLLRQEDQMRYIPGIGYRSSPRALESFPREASSTRSFKPSRTSPAQLRRLEVDRLASKYYAHLIERPISLAFGLPNPLPQVSRSCIRCRYYCHIVRSGGSKIAVEHPRIRTYHVQLRRFRPLFPSFLLAKFQQKLDFRWGSSDGGRR